jgi:F-type H+-transporting ATPase subunit b
MSEAFDALGINVPQLIAQIVNFVILLVVLRLTLFGPIMRMLDDRKTRIAEGLNAAEIARAEAQDAQARIDEQLRDAQQRGQVLVGNAQEIAKRIEEEARAEAARDREVSLQRARAEIQRERDAAIAELRGEFAALTILAAERVINQSLDRDAHQRIIDEALAQSSFGDN